MGLTFYVRTQLTRKLLPGILFAVILLMAAAHFLGLSWPDGRSASHQADASPPRETAPATPAPGLAVGGTTTPAMNTPVGSPTSATQLLNATSADANHAETRLIRIYALIEQGEFHAALSQAEALARDKPHFQLAQLVYGDLLRLRFQPDATLSDETNSQMLSLRAESRKRLEALRERPSPGTVPHQFVALSSKTRHAIAIDASRSRLYLFENQSPPGADSSTPASMKLIADFFISVGKSGIDKKLEGDGRTPLGNYYITSAKSSKTLPPFYGAGALPINYPNAFDHHQGRTGFGIWLHGTPPNQFVRAPLASDGCVVLSNPDMEKLLDTVSPRTTPVVIAEQLQWINAQALDADRQHFEDLLKRWQAARSTMSAEELHQTFGAPSQRAQGEGSAGIDLTVATHAKLGVANVSLLQSTLPQSSLVATFDETVDGAVTAVTRRQYWHKQGERWQLLQDTVIAGTPALALKRAPARPVQLASAAETKQAATRNDEERQRPNRPAKTGEPNAASSDQEQVRQAIQAWARAWEQKNMGAYLSAYDQTFDPPGGLSRKAWEKDRTDRIIYKSKISVNLGNLQVKVNGNTATSTFVQRYQADQLKVSGRKTLKLIKRGNNWRITQESIGN